jgi:hypothetical protein
MKMKLYRSLVVMFVLFASVVTFAHEKIWPEKRLRRAWPDAQSFTSKQINLSPSQSSKLIAEGVKIGAVDRNLTFYFPQSKPSSSEPVRTLGAIVFIDEYGENGKMDISVAMGSDGRVKNVDLWEQSENPAVSKDTFLKQFVGKSGTDSFSEPPGLVAVAAAPKASGAVAAAVKKALRLTELAFGHSKESK